MLPLGQPAGPLEAVLTGLSRARPGHGCLRRRGPSSTRRGRRARLQTAVAGHDAGALGRPRALHRDVLVALPGGVDARRLGVGRRGRLLVPARAQRRHAQRRGQADRARGARVGRRRAPGCRRGGRDRGPSRREGRGAVALCVLNPGARSTRRRSQTPWRTSSARHSSRRESCSYRRCRRRGARRSCVAPSGRPRSDRPGRPPTLENPSRSRRSPRVV